MIDRGLSEEYVAWWLENAEPGVGYDCARHLEIQLSCAGRFARRRPESLLALYDFFRRRYDEPLAAEAFRRALTALAAPASMSRRP